MEGDDDLWSRIIDSMIRRSQQEPGSANEPTQLDSRNPTPGATLKGPGAAPPVSREEAAEYLAGLEEEFPEDEEPAKPDRDQGSTPCDDVDEKEDTASVDSPPRLRARLARRSRISVGLLMTLGLLDLVLSIYLALKGHWLLALLG